MAINFMTTTSTTSTTTMTTPDTSLKLQVQPSCAAFLTIDCPGKTNTLNSSTMEELGNVLQKIVGDEQIKALVLLSGKPNIFLSGADLHEIMQFKDNAQAYQMVKRGHEVFARLANLKIPVVVGIHGACLGGGLELALCAHRRVATTDGVTQLGLPEVNLGLIPGLGGTQRLPHLIGLKPALDMILSAKILSAEEARVIGLVDEVVEAPELTKRLEEIALELISQDLSQQDLSQNESRKLLVPDGVAGDMDKFKSILATSERAARIRTRGNYPAFGKAIEAIREGIVNGLNAGLEAEAAAFGELAISKTAHNLINLFFAKEIAIRQAKKHSSLVSDAPSMRSMPNVPDIPGVLTNNKDMVGIVGAGLMGSGIAELTASSSTKTVLVESDPDRLAVAVQELQKKLDTNSIKTLWTSRYLKDLINSRTIIEAITEDQASKTKLFQQLENIVTSDCLLASNTSCLSITALADSITHSNRLLGMHFFHPVDRMPLVEVIVHPDVDQQSVDKACALIVKLGKVPIIVQDSPGFLVNRILCPYLVEAALIAEDGVPMNWIEDSALAFGMPMGPFALMDEIGLDVSFKVAKLLHESFDGRLRLPELLHKMETLGLLGKKNRSGFFDYDDSGAKKSFNAKLIEFAGLKTSTEKMPVEEAAHLQQRLMLPMVNEATRCLNEKVVRKAWQVDLAMVLGTGFPSFRGGPLRYADSVPLP